MGGKGSGGLKVSQINNQLIEVQQDTANYQASLRAACFNAISPDDMAQVVAKQLEKAKEGDVKAANFMMSLVGSNSSTRIQQTNIFATDVEGAARIAKAQNG